MIEKSHKHETFNFPKGFLWGASTSAHQVEGMNKNNDWWAWENSKNKKIKIEKSGKATNHYELYKQDFDIAKKLNHNAHRLSIEWSRIEPREGKWDMDELAHYKDVLTQLKKRGISPMVTLHHFTNPTWFSEQGGWENRESVEQFSNFVKFIVKNLGSQVDLWITFNEPGVYIVNSFVLGYWPPGKKSYWKALKVFINLVKSHKLAYKIIHKSLDKKKVKAKVGFANNFVSFTAYNKHSILDALYVRIGDYIWNHIFYARTKGTHDFLGINYYFHQRLKREPGQFFKYFFDVREENREMSDLGWEIYPQGIFEALLDLTDMNLPIYITENGLATMNDDKRQRFIVSYLKEIYHAIQAGADVKGYFHWSLLDNFEWDKGFYPRFGLVDVNYKTYKRTPRKSAEVLAEIAKKNGIPHRLLRLIGHEAKL